MLNLKLVTTSILSIDCSQKCAALFGKRHKVVQKFNKYSGKCSCYVAEELFIFTDSERVDGVVYSYEHTLEPIRRLQVPRNCSSCQDTSIIDGILTCDTIFELTDYQYVSNCSCFCGRGGERVMKRECIFVEEKKGGQCEKTRSAVDRFNPCDNAILVDHRECYRQPCELDQWVTKMGIFPDTTASVGTFDAYVNMTTQSGALLKLGRLLFSYNNQDLYRVLVHEYYHVTFDVCFRSATEVFEKISMTEPLDKGFQFNYVALTVNGNEETYFPENNGLLGPEVVSFYPRNHPALKGKDITTTTTQNVLDAGPMAPIDPDEDRVGGPMAGCITCSEESPPEPSTGYEKINAPSGNMEEAESMDETEK